MFKLDAGRHAGSREWGRGWLGQLCCEDHAIFLGEFQKTSRKHDIVSSRANRLCMFVDLGGMNNSSLKM